VVAEVAGLLKSSHCSRPPLFLLSEGVALVVVLAEVADAGAEVPLLRSRNCTAFVADRSAFPAVFEGAAAAEVVAAAVFPISKNCTGAAEAAAEEDVAGASAGALAALELPAVFLLRSRNCTGSAVLEVVGAAGAETASDLPTGLLKSRNCTASAAVPDAAAGTPVVLAEEAVVAGAAAIFDVSPVFKSRNSTVPDSFCFSGVAAKRYTEMQNGYTRHVEEITDSSHLLLSMLSMSSRTT
jgi:hypothetical protein